SPVLIEQELWQDLPNLEFLGGSAQWMVIVDSPPFDHPLVQLALDDFVSSDNIRLYSPAEEMIKKVPNLRRFGMAVPHPNSEDKDGRVELDGSYTLGPRHTQLTT
ncbi:7255_t:CDS:2, partial [Acaulospora colombiana]